MNQDILVAPAVNKVLRNTYILLSMTLAFSALCTYLTLGVEFTFMFAIGGFLGSLVLLFMLSIFKDSVLSIPLVFAFTGTMGAFCGPAIQQYLLMPGGQEIVLISMAATATMVLLLSGYALVSKTDFSAWGGFLLTGLLVILGAMILNIFLNIPALTLTISGCAVLVFSGLILYDTSRIIHGGETNYVMATVSLYLDIMNLFLHLLQLVGFLGDD